MRPIFLWFAGSKLSRALAKRRMRPLTSVSSSGVVAGAASLHRGSHPRGAGGAAARIWASGLGISQL